MRRWRLREARGGAAAALLIALWAVCAAVPARAQCRGDLNGDGAVGVDELITAVNSALSGCGLDPSCPGDFDGNGSVSVDELVAAVDNAIYLCPRALYVRDRVGNDRNDGLSPTSAVRTITTAAARARPGDTIVVGPGVYSESVVDPPGGQDGRLLTFLADSTGTLTTDQPGEIVLNARGTGNPGFRLSRVRFVVIDGFSIVGGSTAGVQVRLSSSEIAVRNCLINDALGDGVLVQDSDDILLFNNVIDDNSRRGVAFAGSQRGRLINNTIVRNGENGIFLGARNNRASSGAFLRNNVIQDNVGINIEVAAAAPSSLVGFDSRSNLVFPVTYAPDDLMSENDINSDALFVEPEASSFRLSQVPPAEPETSLAVDAGVEEDRPTRLAVSFDDLRRRTTASDSRADSGVLDLGYHYAIGPEMPRPARTLYVRRSGRDFNDGSTPQKALRRITRAVALAVAGDRIVVGPGEYAESSINPPGGTAALPVTLLGDPSGRLTLDVPGAVVVKAGGADTGFRLTRARFVVIDGFTVTEAVQGIAVRSTSDSTVIRNCQVVGNDDGIVVLDSAGVSVINNLVVGNVRRGIVIGGIVGSPGVRLINNTVAGNPERGILIGSGSGASPGAFLQNNIIQGNGATNLQIAVSSLDAIALRFNLVFPATYNPDDERLPHPDDLAVDALFVDAVGGDYRLEQSGEVQSPAVDAADPATDDAIVNALLPLSTAATGIADTAPLDLGFHYPRF